ncbi:phage head morphogenesis protein [Porphyromonas loveana]
MIADEPIRAVTEETHRILADGLREGLEYEVPEEVLYALDNNAYIFSGFKTYHSLREVGLSLTTDEGEIKPYRQFLGEVHEIDAKYNRHYLEAEYDHAVGSAMMAGKWHEQTKGGDKYYLQYRTAADSAVRPAHQKLEGITLPSSDPFWSSYYPPNGWRCRCDVVEVLREDYEMSDSEEASKLGDTVLTTNKERVFKFNPGKELKLYPDKHPYFGKHGIDHCSTDGRGKECELLGRILEGKEEYTKVETSRGELLRHRDIGAQELNQNIMVGRYLAERYGESIVLLPEEQGKKRADSYNNTRAQYEEYKVLESHTLNAIKMAIRKGAHQANNVVLWLKDEVPSEIIGRALGSRFKDYPNLQSVRIIYENGNRDVVYRREDYI